MKITKLNILTLVFSIMASIAIAQDQRTLETKIADLLAQMPAKDLIQRDRLMSDMFNLGNDGFQKMAAMLKAPGQGDDTAVRFAINSLARYSSQFGKDRERDFTESNIIKAIENQSDRDIRAFLAEELHLIASEKSVSTVKGFLNDEKLSDVASRILVSVKGKASADALLSALPASNERTAINIVKALGSLQCKNAVQQITNYADSKNVSLKKIALEALAEIGDPSSYNLLLSEATKANWEYNQVNATESFLNYTVELGKNNDSELCKKACDAIFSANMASGKLHNYSKALAVYTKYFGFEAMPFLLKAVESNDKPFRMSALLQANQIKDIAATRQWIEKAKSVSPEAKAEIIGMLGVRGDMLAKGLILESLNSGNEILSESSVPSLTTLCGKDAVPVLLNQLKNARNMQTTKSALLQLLDQEHLNLVAELLPATNGIVKAFFIDLIAAKNGTDYSNLIFPLTSSEDPNVRIAAFKALKNISTEKNIYRLIDLLTAVKISGEIENVQQAIVAVTAGSEAEKNGKGKLAEAMKVVASREKLIAIFPSIGGKVNLQTVGDLFKNGKGVEKEAAFNALLSWNEYDAAKLLFEICQTNTGEYRAKALESFIRQVAKAQIPDDQKLLEYRKAMLLASEVKEKKEIIRYIGKLKTFLSLVYLKNYMNDKELQQETALSVMNIALPNSAGNNGFSGDIVKELLEKSIATIKGEDSEYYKINMRNYLNTLSADKGFVSMFNGKNLEGWQGLVENPVARSKMSPADLASKQKIANVKMAENWSVRDNTIVFSGKGDNLCSVKKYGDFEMIVDWRITKNGDSGIYLRGTPQVQIWDTSRVDVGAQVGSGGLYNNQKNLSKPLKLADNAIGEWNTFRITMIGENVTIFLNGVLVVDNVPLENYWDRKLPIFPSEAIELQAHGTDLAFRDIYVHEINTKQIGLSKQEIEEGFESLFNGKNLAGWQGNLTDYYAVNGEMVVQPSRGGKGNIYTAKEYSNFIFRFDFQLTPGANNGLGIRAPLEGDAAYVGMELQILDNTAPIYANLHEYQYHGSVYGVIPAKREYLKPVGQWNSEEVIVKGSKVKVILNGVTIVDGDIKEASKNGTLDGKAHPGLLRETGFIGFLGHGSELKFRNLRIKEL